VRPTRWQRFLLATCCTHIRESQPSFTLRVLQLCKFYPPVVGGIESVAFELTEGLNRQRCKTGVLCANEQATSEIARLAAGYIVTRAAPLDKLLST